MDGKKLASNIWREWRRAYWRGKSRPAHILLSPSAAEKLGRRSLPVKPRIVDTWAWGWLIELEDGGPLP